jgi:hypothetical protein
MKYIVQTILILIVFIASSRAKKNAIKTLELKRVEWGMFTLNPVTGDKAQRLASVAVFLSNICPWVLILVFLLIDLLDWIRIGK